MDAVVSPGDSLQHIDFVRFFYSMIKNMDKSNLLFALGQVETIVGQEKEGEKEEKE
jgi:hypothetical protein